jgi:hypothetical protein
MVTTLQHVLIYNELATKIDNVPEFEQPLYQIADVGKALTVPVDLDVPPHLSVPAWVGLVNRNVRHEPLRLRFGMSLFRAAVSLLLEDEFEFKIGVIVVDLYGGNPHGVVTAIQWPQWSEYNRNVDRQMLRDCCLKDQFIMDDSTKMGIRDFLLRTGDLV